MDYVEVIQSVSACVSFALPSILNQTLQDRKRSTMTGSGGAIGAKTTMVTIINWLATFTGCLLARKLLRFLRLLLRCRKVMNLQLQIIVI